MFTHLLNGHLFVFFLYICALVIGLLTVWLTGLIISIMFIYIYFSYQDVPINSTEQPKKLFYGRKKNRETYWYHYSRPCFQDYNLLLTSILLIEISFSIFPFILVAFFRVCFFLSLLVLEVNQLMAPTVRMLHATDDVTGHYGKLLTIFIV